jgi:hypothetical protein
MHLAGVVIAVDVGSGQFGKSATAIDEAPGDRAKIAVGMFEDGGENGGGAAGAFGAKRVRAFTDAPAVVASAFNPQHHFPEILSDVAPPEIASLAVEAELPELPEAVSVNLGAGVGLVEEGVVGGDGVGAGGVAAVDIDAEQAGEQIVESLAGLAFIGDATAIAARDVEKTVGAEGEVAAVVSARGPFDEHLLGLGAQRGAAVEAAIKPRHAAAAGSPFLRVGDGHDIQAAVAGEVRMGGDAVDGPPDIAQGRGRGLGIHGERVQGAAAFGDDKTARATEGGDGDGLEELRVGKGGANDVGSGRIGTAHDAGATEFDALVGVKPGGLSRSNHGRENQQATAGQPANAHLKAPQKRRNQRISAAS